MDYAKAVAKARTLHARSEADQWELARLTYEATTGPEAGTLTQWAKDLGFSQPHATNLRKVWIRFGLHKGPNSPEGMTFNECYTRVMVSKEREPELVKRAKREGRRVSTVRDRHRRDRELEDVKKAILNDPELRRQILEDPESRRNIEKELRRYERRREEMTEAEVRILDEMQALNARAREILSDLLDATLTREERGQLEEIIEDIQVTIVWMRSYLRTGTRSFEDALDALLADAPPATPIGDPKRRRKVPAGPPSQEAPVGESPADEAPATPDLSSNGDTPPAKPRRVRKRRIPDRSTDPLQRPGRKRRAG